MTSPREVEDFLAHYGVKGMKWGVRKGRQNDLHDRSVILKKNTTLQNISGRRERSIDDKPIFGAYTDKDRLNYASYYADQLKTFEGVRTVYKNDLIVKKDIRIPSEKVAAETFMDTFRKNPEAMARSIAKARADTAFFGSLGKTFNMDIESRTVRQYSKKGDDWMKTKGYSQFNSTFVTSKGFESQKLYFDALTKKGYGGVRDLNDINNSYKSESPVIVFNPKSSLRTGKTQKLSMREINSSLALYQKTYESGKR